MEDDLERQNYQIGPRGFLFALSIVLIGVFAGYFLLVRPQERQRPADKPTALGHAVPELPANQGTNATNHVVPQ